MMGMMKVVEIAEIVKDGVLPCPIGAWTMRFILLVTVIVKPKKIRSLKKPRIKNYSSVAKS